MLTLKTTELFDLSHTLANELLGSCEYPWHALPHIKEFVIQLGRTLSEDEYDNPVENVWISKSATVAESATICAPAIIGHGSEIRVGAYIRGAVIVGEDCVVGNSCEIKNAILFDKVQVPHFNYVGDSVLGYCAHMGAGAITSNVKSDRSPVTVKAGEEMLETGFKKFGAMLGDFVEIGCNSVLNPGSVVGRNTTVYPLSSVRGCIPKNSIFKSPTDIITKN